MVCILHYSGLKSEAMKTIKFKVVSLFWILGLFFISLNGYSQERKLTRQEMKEVRKAQLEANFWILDSLLNAKSFRACG